MLLLLQASATLFWLVGTRLNGDAWTFVSLDVFGLIYFYSRWAAPNAQHRTLLFLLMCQFLITTCYFAFQMAVRLVAIDPVAMSPWWYQAIANVITVVNLVLLFVYSLLRIRARKDPKKWRDGVSAHFDGAERVRAGRDGDKSG